MKKIVEYLLIEGAHIEQIEGPVKDLISQGFEPFGHLAIAVCEDTVWLIQAMVRYEEVAK